MNERIRLLAEQSVSRFDKDMDGSMEPTENGRWVYYDDLTEFAELIVQECSNFLKDTLDDHFAAEQLEEHFGVEE